MDRDGSQGTRHGLASIAGAANRSCQRCRRQCKVPWLAANQGGPPGGCRFWRPSVTICPNVFSVGCRVKRHLDV